MLWCAIMMYLKPQNYFVNFAFTDSTRKLTNLLIVISAMQRSETPTFPYWMNGTNVHRNPSPCIHAPWMYRTAINGSTSMQNKQSATHKLLGRREKNYFEWKRLSHRGPICGSSTQSKKKFFRRRTWWWNLLQRSALWDIELKRRLWGDFRRCLLAWWW